MFNVPSGPGGVEHDARSQNFGQNNGRRGRVLGINQDQRHSGAVEMIQFGGDRVGKPGIIAQQCDGIHGLEFCAYGRDFNAGLFIHLAGEAPIGGEIHEDGFAGGAGGGDGFRAPALPVDAVH